MEAVLLFSVIVCLVTSIRACLTFIRALYKKLMRVAPGISEYLAITESEPACRLRSPKKLPTQLQQNSKILPTQLRQEPKTSSRPWQLLTSWLDHVLYVCHVLECLGSAIANFFGSTSYIPLLKSFHAKRRMGPDARSEPWLREALWQKVEQGIGNYWDPFLDYTIAKLCGLPSTVQSTEIILNELPIKSKTAAESPSLETLASELRLIILQSIPDFDDIMSLIRASPVFLQHYLGEKKSLLAGCLKMSLNTVLVDAMAVQRAATLRGDKSVNRHHIQTHLNMYCLERECGESEIEKLIKNHNEDFLFDIFLFWQTYVRPLAVRFTRLFLFRFDPQRPPIFTQLSPTENTRLLRALYRFELYSYLFGGESRHLQLDYTEEQMLALFFCLFRPWEVEEIFSIYTLVHDEMTTRLRMMEKKMFHNVTREFAFTGGAASWGLRGFDMVLKDTNLYSMTTIRSSSNRWTSGYGFMENILSQRAQERRRSIWPNDDDLAEDRGDPLPYVGESESEPSYGWVLVCKEKYLNAYGGDVKNPSPRDWGYVFWDRWRLTKFNGDKKLKSSSWVPGAAA